MRNLSDIQGQWLWFVHMVHKFSRQTSRAPPTANFSNNDGGRPLWRRKIFILFFKGKETFSHVNLNVVPMC